MVVVAREEWRCGADSPRDGGSGVLGCGGGGDDRRLADNGRGGYGSLRLGCGRRLHLSACGNLDVVDLVLIVQCGKSL